MSGSGSSSETELPTEPSGPGPRAEWAGTPYRASDHPRIADYRRWWQNTPLNNVWTPKPALWSRFEKEVVQGKTPEEAAFGGANVTLNDLRRPPLPAGGQEESDIENLPSDQVFLGRPDSEEYEPGTQALTQQQLEQEMKKGNVFTLRQLRQAWADAPEWERRQAEAMLEARDAQRTPAITFEDGSWISVYDLVMHTDHNPELRAMKDRGLRLPLAGESREAWRKRLLAEPSWKRDLGATSMGATLQEAAAMPWGMVAEGERWSRQPIRWLKGLNGRRDYEYGAFVVEAAAQQLLGPKWGRRDRAKVLGDPEFRRDVVRAAPALQATLMFTACRPLPIVELQDVWTERLSQALARQAAAGGVPASMPLPEEDGGKAGARGRPELPAFLAPLTALWGGTGEGAAGADAAPQRGAKQQQQQQAGPQRFPPFAALTNPFALFSRGTSSGSSGTESSEASGSATSSSSESEAPPVKQQQAVRAASAAPPRPPPAAPVVAAASPPPPAMPAPTPAAPPAPPAPREQPVVAQAVAQAAAADAAAAQAAATQAAAAQAAAMQAAAADAATAQAAAAQAAAAAEQRRQKQEQQQEERLRWQQQQEQAQQPPPQREGKRERRLREAQEAQAAAEAATAAASQRAAAALPVPTFQPEGPYAEELCHLRSIFDAADLAAATKLVDASGQLLREGSKILFTATPEGKMLIQATSPGSLAEQESYVLGAVRQPALTAALLALFLDPDQALDRRFANQAAEGVLEFANGYRTFDDVRYAGAKPVPQPTFLSKWQLPAVGHAAPQAAPQPLLLEGLRTDLWRHQLGAAVAGAQRAAEAAQVPADVDARQARFARRAAAESALRRAFGEMGVDASALTLPPPDVAGAMLAAGGELGQVYAVAPRGGR